MEKREKYFLLSMQEVGAETLLIGHLRLQFHVYVVLLMHITW
jgi:hypothetical protein